jgi:hypothetical protein
MTVTTKGTFKCALDKCTSSICADFGGKWFKVVTDVGKIEFNRLWADMAALKCNIVTRGFGCGVNGHVV